MIDRREALRRLGLGALSLSLPGSLLASCARTPTRANLVKSGPTDFDQLSPVNRYREPGLRVFSGDNPDRFHQILWNKQATLKQRHPEHKPEDAGLVVIGGGMSGIMTAYLLRDQKPILLDKSERFGGNSRGESWGDVDYSIGAAYLCGAEPTSPLHPLYKNAGIFELCRKRTDADPVAIDQRIYNEFWSGESDPKAARQFTRLRDFFLDRFQGKVAIPSIPTENERDVGLLAELDRTDFLSYLVQQLGEPLHPHVHTVLELYCWSTLGASMQELSAAIGVTTYAWEFGEILVAPAGNSSVAERFLQLLAREVPAANLRPNSVVADVKPGKDHVDVTYVDKLGTLRVIRARAVVMACPKFVAKRLIDGYDTKERAEAMSRMGYRAYVVGNACLKRPPTRDLHDVYLLRSGEMPFGETRRNQHNHGTTDVIFANFGQTKKDRTVLTMYHPLPFDEGRAELLIPDAWDVFQNRLKGELVERILPLLNYQTQDLEELRLTRWGHPIPFAKPGFYWNGGPRTLAKPIAGRVFFVNQDTWAAPAIETCASEALRWAPKIREVLT